MYKVEVRRPGSRSEGNIPADDTRSFIDNVCACRPRIEPGKGSGLHPNSSW